jgi:hypothetical protein
LLDFQNSRYMLWLNREKTCRKTVNIIFLDSASKPALSAVEWVRNDKK